jgi:hypothetical protein
VSEEKWSFKYPIGADLAREWATEFDYPLEDSGRIERVAQYIGVEEDPRSPKDRIAKLLEKASPPDFEIENEPHRVLASLGLPVYLTSDFDDYLLRALRRAEKDVRVSLCRWNKHIARDAPAFDPDPAQRDHIPYCTVTEGEEPGALTYTPATDPIYKPSALNPLVYYFHGHFIWPASLVVSEDDYFEFLLNLSKASPPLIMPREIDRVYIDRDSPAFQGVASADHAARSAGVWRLFAALSRIQAHGLGFPRALPAPRRLAQERRLQTHRRAARADRDGRAGARCEKGGKGRAVSRRILRSSEHQSVLGHLPAIHRRAQTETWMSAAPELEPYAGPRAFGRDERQRFFGRDRESDDLLSLVLAHPVVLVYAASRAGKSSLLNAGLIPRLEDEEFHVLGSARVAGPLPADAGGIANTYLFHALSRWNSENTGLGLSLTELAGMTLQDFLQRLDQRCSGKPRALIFDQFEEFFTHVDKGDERRVFIGQIADALGDAPRSDRRLKIVFAMRKEYVVQFEPFVYQLPEKLRTRMRLEPLRAREAMDAVRKPLEALDLEFEAAGSRTPP